jgi:hypothetical protein
MLQNISIASILKAWITASLYMKLSKKRNVSLLPVSSVHMHPKAEDRPGYYSDVIIHKSLAYYSIHIRITYR